MKLGLVKPGFRDRLAKKLADFFQGHDEVSAAYLFGSASEDGPVVNDIDVLVLLGESDINQVLFLLSRLDVALARYLGISTEQLDLVPFDFRVVEPGVLYEALNTGILLKCADEETLTDAIEGLSRYFLENEGTLRMQRDLRQEMHVW